VFVVGVTTLATTAGDALIDFVTAGLDGVELQDISVIAITVNPSV
jgi:hypothetical protein